MFSSRVPRSSNESRAPHLIKDSSALRFKFFDPTRERKSASEEYAPRAFLSSKIACATPSPKFLIEESPKRIAPKAVLSLGRSSSEDGLATTVNTVPLSFTSGGKTGILMRLHSVTKSAICAVSAAAAGQKDPTLSNPAPRHTARTE